MLKRITAGSLTALAFVTAVGLATPANAEASANVSVGTQYGSVLRGQFHQNVDGSGYFFRTYGSADCTSTTSDVDIQISNMTDYAWDNAASWAQDYNGCDTKLFRYKDFDTALTGWIDYGSTGQSLSGALNNLTTSFKLS